MTDHNHAPAPGPVMLDVAGTELSEAEAQQLRHPLVGGVILFARNYRDPAQLCRLTAAIREARASLLIAVDHEGGRVQRFRKGFTRVPPMRCLGRIWESSPDAARELATGAGHVLAAELRAHGVDLSFTPVLDLDYGHSTVIGDRAFHSDPVVTAALADALADGLAAGGMGCVGKHFPGHGHVAADSHVALPVDGRSFEEIWARDIQPYRERIGRRLSGVMPAHVIYECVDPQPAGFSRFWLQDVLRGRLRFDGAIFSDDLSMEGASIAGGIVARADAALAAGCDMVLVCNRPESAAELLRDWRPTDDVQRVRRICALRREGSCSEPAQLAADEAYLSSRRAIASLSAALA